MITFKKIIELDSPRIKPVVFINGGMRQTIKDETEKANGNATLALISSLISAIFPPIKLPIESPRRVTPITEVHVNTELPTIGEATLAETSSTTMRENPDKKEAQI